MCVQSNVLNDLVKFTEKKHFTGGGGGGCASVCVCVYNVWNTVFKAVVKSNKNDLI